MGPLPGVVARVAGRQARARVPGAPAPADQRHHAAALPVPRAGGAGARARFLGNPIFVPFLYL